MLRLFEESLNIYNRLITERFNVDHQSLTKLMDEVPTMLPISMIIKPQVPSSHLPPPPQAVVKAVITPTETTKAVVEVPAQKQPGGARTCPHRYNHGVKANTICGVRIKTEGDFCGKHSKKEKKVKEPKIEGEEVPILPPKNNEDRVLRMNKVINRFWHSGSGLVFKSPQEKIVIGVFRDDQIMDLSDKDIENCIALKFKYEVTKRKRADDDDEEEEGQGQKKQKIDDDFITSNINAKNVETIIKDMFVDKEDSDDYDEEEEVNDGDFNQTIAEEFDTIKRDDDDVKDESDDAEDDAVNDDDVLEEEEDDE